MGAIIIREKHIRVSSQSTQHRDKKFKYALHPKITMSRYTLVTIFLLGFALIILARSWQLQITDYKFFQKQGEDRQLRIITTKSVRGAIKDRSGYPLAVTTNMVSVWMNPKKLDKKHHNLTRLLKSLKISKKKFAKMANKKTRFIYLKRQISPKVGVFIKSLKITGVHLQKEKKRYYSAGSLVSQIIGFTNVDNKGQEGLELFYDSLLQGKDGKRKVLKNRAGEIIETVQQIDQEVEGIDLTLSIDKDMQFFAYQSLRKVMKNTQADSASLVILNVKNGEVVAMASMPTYNPNNPKQRSSHGLRNRVITDVIEPGSVMKIFTMAVALLTKKVQVNQTVDTSPGYITIGDRTVTDVHSMGLLTMSDVIKKSSNVGISKIALKVQDKHMWRILYDFGFGLPPASGFPGESSGVLRHYKQWDNAMKVSLSYGYSMSASLLQIARAYGAIASGGVLKKISLLRTKKINTGKRVLPKKIARIITKMLTRVTEQDGTAPQAVIDGVVVAGKTGTVKKTSSDGGYTDDKYISLFAGFAPADNPQYVCAVMVDNPKGGRFYGGSVAAPVFAEIMKKALFMPQNINKL
ncbi:MAG: penicillin-binding protein 2 [Gammaproteobacteria bacterium]|nr:MAG: penicillin-binding protein 2 [Gammaproteobacteria bacterium]